MGSSSSSNSVKSINLEPSGDRSADKSSATNKTREQDKGRKHGSGAAETKEASKDPTNTPPPPATDRDAEIIELTRQLCESESQRLDLEDKIEALEETLEYNKAQTLLQAEQPCDETLHAKDQYIVKLEKEKTDLQTDLNKLRQKHKRKLKQFNSQMAEYKQETNFQMMELKEEIQKLKQDNKKLQGINGKANGKVVSELDEDTPKLPGGEKMKLILELSEQVTEQGDKISKLEKKLRDKDQTIDELRVKLKNNTEYLKAIDEKTNGVKVGSGDRNNNYNGRSVGRTMNRDCLKSSAVKGPKRVGPLAQDTDDDFTDTASMKKLTSMLQGFKAKTEVGRLSIDSIDECRETTAKGVSIVEEGVGTGRDSGLGSAGKREEEKANTATAPAGNQLDWNSMDSDSEADGNQFLQSKILSAPAHLQGVRNQKLKKKNSSLKNRSSLRVADRPPRPGLAFVSKAEDQAEEKEDNIWDGHPLSPIMSPIEVS